MSSEDEIAESFYRDIQEKNNIVRKKSGLLPFLDESGSYESGDPDSLDGFHVVNLYEGLGDYNDRKMLNDLYCQVLKEEKLEEEKQETEENE